MIYRFGQFALDPDRLELRAGEKNLTIEPQVFSLLAFLVENRDRVLTKDEIIENVWQGRIVSDGTLNSRINAARRAVGDNGTDQAIIRTLPRRGFRFVAELDSKDEAIPPQWKADPRAPDRPSIAVLPFVNMSGDPEQEFFADGMVDEIITSLSRLRWLYVTSRTSSFEFKGRNQDVRDIARKLGVRYLLEGSVRKAGDRVRIIGQLIEAETGTHLWAERFDGHLANVFDLQDEITDAVVGAIEPSLLSSEIDRARRKRPENLNAYECYLRALPHLYKSTRNSVETALSLLDESMALDPSYAPACAMAAWVHMFRVIVNWSPNPGEEAGKGALLARKALEADANDPIVLASVPFVLATVGDDVDGGATASERAVQLYPNSAEVVGQSGYVLTLLGDQERSLERFNSALRLSPNNPLAYRFYTGASIACTLMGRYDDAITYGERSRRANDKWGVTYRILAAAYAQLGQVERATESISRYLDLDPSESISHLKQHLPYRDQEQAERLWDGLRKAGLPE